MSNREAMLKKLSAAEFAHWEMHLYLDTHPWDMAMVEKATKAMYKCAALKNEFEENHFKLTAKSASGVEWLKAPWPWDIEECDC